MRIRVLFFIVFLIIILMPIAMAGNRDNCVAVLTFEGRLIDVNHAVTMSELIRFEIGEIEHYEVIDRGSMELILKEQDLQDDDCTETSCAVDAGKILNVRWIIIGSLSKIGNRYLLISRRVDVQTAEIVDRSRRDAMDIESLIDTIPDVARELLGLEAVSSGLTSHEITKIAPHSEGDSDKSSPPMLLPIENHSGGTNSTVQPPDPWANAVHGKVNTVNLGGGVSLDMVYIQGGTYQMGQTTPKEELLQHTWVPVHSVSLNSFWMGKHEVTQAQYLAIMGENPSFFKGSNLPVERVSWNNAMEFCRKLSSRTGQLFTLPTEAQWEYACRAGSQTRYCFGDSYDALDYYAWFVINSGSKTHYVGRKRANAWGLYDMHGNVMEWCLDDWHDDYINAPDDGSRWRSKSGLYRVIRGGSWMSGYGSTRSGDRTDYTHLFKSDDLGFRVCLPGQ